MAVLVGMGCGNGEISASGSPATFGPKAAYSESGGVAKDDAQPMARWDTAYDRPQAAQIGVTQTVRAWTAAGLPLPPRCLADLMDARIEVWPNREHICGGESTGCYFQRLPSLRPVVQLHKDVRFAYLLAHEFMHLLEHCAELHEPDHQGPGFEVVDEAAELIETRVGGGTVADVLGLEVQS